MRLSRKSMLRLLLLVPACLLLLLVLAAVVERARGRYAVSRLKRALVETKQVHTPADLTRNVDPESNGSSAFRAAGESITNLSHISEVLPPLMRINESGAALPVLRLNHWQSEDVTNDWSTLAAISDPHQAALSAARDALTKPVLDNQLDYAAGPQMPLTHLIPIKNLSHAFGASMLLALRAKDSNAAVADLEAQLQLLRALESDRILISELVRMALGAISRNYTWQALQYHGWNDSHLARLQAAWEAVSFLQPLTRGLEGERVFSGVAYQLMRQSNEDTVAFLFWAEDMEMADFANLDADAPWPVPKSGHFLRNEVYCRVWRFCWLDQCEAHYLESLQGLLVAARAAASHRSQQQLQSDVSALLNSTRPASAYDRARFRDETSINTLAPSITRALRMETERSLVLTAIALHRFAVKNRGFPESLTQLVPDFLPVDYMDGQPVRYRLNADKSFLLYSVGEDGKDDGGDISFTDGKQRGNIWLRRDVVWPQAEITSGSE